jgi:hypothetical protein
VRVLGSDSTYTLVACVADGAGSAKHSNFGASIACDTVHENAAIHFEANGGLDRLELDDIQAWCDDARARIHEAAKVCDCQPRDFATTLSAAIIGPASSFFFQIGDGAIILGNGVSYGVVFWPQSGEYANSTNFLTSDEYRQQLEFLAITSACSKLAMMTDGLERLALKFDSQTPHVPFFDPLFLVLQSSQEIENLNDGLRTFLGSHSVQLRSDDDKTLILAARTADSAD